MSLSGGVYIVASLEGNRSIGRSHVEDYSLRPKQVFALPQGMPGSVLIVEKNDKGFTIKAQGATTGVQNDAVFAFLQNEKSEDWIITARPQHGKDVFTIETQDRSKGWVLGDQNENGLTEIKVEALNTGFSQPPMYPTSELFTFIHLPTPY